jgi:hypothetical protein
MSCRPVLSLQLHSFQGLLHCYQYDCAAPASLCRMTCNTPNTCTLEKMHASLFNNFIEEEIIITVLDVDKNICVSVERTIFYFKILFKIYIMATIIHVFEELIQGSTLMTINNLQ